MTVKNAFDHVSTKVDVQFFNDTNLRLYRKRSVATKFVFVSSRYFSKYFVKFDEFYRVRRRWNDGAYSTAIGADRLDWLTFEGRMVSSGPGIMHTVVLPWLLREGVRKIVVYGWDNMKQEAVGGYFDRSTVASPPENFLHRYDGVWRSVLKPIAEAIFLLPRALRYRSGKMVYRRAPALGEYDAIFSSRSSTEKWLSSLGAVLEIK